MPTNEEIETWTAQAADMLAAKIGPHAAVIVMALNVAGTVPWAVEYRGGPAFIIFLKETGCQEIEERLIPKGTRS